MRRLLSAGKLWACRSASRSAVYKLQSPPSFHDLQYPPSFLLAAAATASSAAATLAMCAEKEEDVFPSKGDPYKGVSVSAQDVAACASTESFSQKLASSIDSWRAAGRLGVWLEVPAMRSELIGAAQAQGFTFHHAEPGYLMMSLWLGKGDNSLPSNASHSVGMGIVCINEHDEVLVVQEASGPAAMRKGGFWKVPTGLVNVGEELSACAVREMKEETGLDVTFIKLLGMRDLQRALHGKGNLFFMCQCMLVEGSSAEIRRQTEELADARWMKIDEYLALPYYQHDGAYAELARATIAAARSEGEGLRRLRLANDPKDPRRGETSIYVHRARL